jgi:hypothetical protein
MAKNFIFQRAITAENPVTPEELRSGESILARLVAVAYAADHPEYFASEKQGLTARCERHTLEAGGTTSCCKQLMAPDHAA